MDINTANVSILKKYLRENGATFPSNARKPALKEQAFKVKKAKDLEQVEQEICKDCGFSIDMCECERCNDCFEVQCECKKALTREKVKAMETMAGQMFKGFKQMMAPQPVQQPVQQIPVKPKTPPKKKIILKRVKKKITKKPVVIQYIEEEEEEIVCIPKQRTEIQKYDLETKLQIKAYKIKLKIFLLKNIMPEPNLHHDVFDLIGDILEKHYITLTEEEKTTFPKLFNRIYQEPNEKQKTILKDIVVYLVNCEFKSF